MYVNDITITCIPFLDFLGVFLHYIESEIYYPVIHVIKTFLSMYINAEYEKIIMTSNVINDQNKLIKM